MHLYKFTENYGLCCGIFDLLTFVQGTLAQFHLNSKRQNKMEQAVSLQVPLIVDIGEGDNWLEAH